MAKARRESQFSAPRSAPGSHEGEVQLRREKWGPGGWQVSERRRMIERSSLEHHSDGLDSPI